MSAAESRNSNIELLRIVSMLAIIGHHMIVNSGIMDSFDYSNITGNLVFLQLWGMWGKTAINCFVMITGYYMCNSVLTIRRYSKIYLEAKFYQVLIFIIFGIVGYESFSGSSILRAVFRYIRGGNDDFTASFLLFYLFIPVLNEIIHKIDRNYFKGIILLLLFTFTIKATFFINEWIFHEVFWYITIYFIAAYIRIYSPNWTKNHKLVRRALILSIGLAYVSVLFLLKYGNVLWFLNRYFFLVDSHKILALAIGVLAFLFFKDLKTPQSKTINLIASTTFGVLCIHASSDAMRKFLWKDLLRVVDLYSQPLTRVVLLSALMTVGVFAFCSIIDLFRLKVLEPPVMRYISANESRWENKLKALWKRIRLF